MGTPSARPTEASCRCACAQTCALGSKDHERGRRPACAPAKARSVRWAGVSTRRRRPTMRRSPETLRDEDLLARVDQPRSLPRPSLADPPAAVRAHAQGPDLRSDRGDDRGGYNLAAGDARRRTQLGLPLQLAAGLYVHALGASHAGLRPGSDRLLLLRRRSGRRRGSADHVRHRRAQAARRGDAGSSLRLRRRPAGPNRQRRMASQAARCLGGVARLRSTPHQLR